MSDQAASLLASHRASARNQLTARLGEPCIRATLKDEWGGSEMLVMLASRRLLAPDGTLLAELDAEDQWRTPSGLACEALMIPAVRASAYVDPREVTRVACEEDRVWRQAAVEQIAQLAERQAQITADDLWEHIEYPPRESRLVGHAFKSAQAQGLIESTGRHERSRRAMNHTRPVLVWRSLHPAHC
jgi:hypothetical protein